MSEVHINSIRFDKGGMVISCDWPGDYFSVRLSASYVVFSRLSHEVFQLSGAYPLQFRPGNLVKVVDGSFFSSDSTASIDACFERSMNEIRDSIAMVREDIRDMNVPRHGIAALKSPWYGRF